MKPLSMLTALISLCILTALRGSAQDAAKAETPQTGIVLVKLSPPVYPQAAKMVRIKGDVTILLAIRQDGSVESAEVGGRYPMLEQAALESAKKSQFECRGCIGVTSYALTYTFAIREECYNSPDCSVAQARPPEILQSPGHVVITVDPFCTCDPAGSITRIKWRSAKCLYLWHCSSRVIDVR
jgi:TonB family protein